MKSGILLLAIVPVLAGCAATAFYRNQSAPAFQPVEPAKVQVYSGDQLSGKYTVIGSIAVDKPGESVSALQLLKERASAEGANAIINVRLTKLTGFTSRTGLSGTAIRVNP